MEKLKKNPALMGVVSTVGAAVLLFIVEFIMSKVKNRTLGEQLSSPINLLILIGGSIATGISSYTKAKANLEKKDKKE